MADPVPGGFSDAGAGGLHHLLGEFLPGEEPLPLDVAPLGLLFAVHPEEVGDDQVGAGDLGRPDQGLGGVGGQEVVAVGELEVIALGRGQGGVPGGGHPAVGPVQKADAAVHPGGGGAQLAGAVGAAVVDQDDLQIGPGLAPQALQAGAQIDLGVVDGDDDAHKGLIQAGHLT